MSKTEDVALVAIADWVAAAQNDAALVAIADWVAAAQKADAYWKAVIAITKSSK